MSTARERDRRREQKARAGDELTDEQAALLMALLAQHNTEQGNARRLVARYGNELIFVPGVRWHHWANTHWAFDETGEVYRNAKQIAADMIALGTTHLATLDPYVPRPKKGPDTRTDAEQANNRAVVKCKKLIEWGQRSEMKATLYNGVVLAQTELAVVTEVSKLDTHMHLLNTPTGTLDLPTGTQRAHDRKDLLTRVAQINYRPEAKCPTWFRFLDEITQGDSELLDYLQRCAGSAISGHASDQLIILHGPGGNGKTTFVDMLANVLGPYAKDVNPETFTTKGLDRVARSDLAGLRGVRLVKCSEIDSSMTLAESTLKQIVGNDRGDIIARFNRMDEFTYRSQMTPLLSCNSLPQVTGTDWGTQRRLAVVPLTYIVPKGKINHRLVEELDAEREGILVWMVAGFPKWNEHRTDPETCAAVKDATTKYLEASDKIAAFLGECCRLDPSLTERSGVIAAAFERWHKLVYPGHKAPGQVVRRLNGRRAAGHTLKAGHDRGGGYVTGLSVRDDYVFEGF